MMVTKAYLLLVFCVALLLLCTGFATDHGNGSAQETAPSSAATSANLAERASLDRTTRIVIYRRADCAPPMRLYLKSIVDGDVVDQLVEALDTDVKLTKQEAGAGAYEIAFHLDDGVVQRFGYDCCLASPAYLHGAQAFLGGSSAIAPDAFNALMAAALDAVPEPACSPAPQ